MVNVAKVNMYGDTIGTFSLDSKYNTIQFQYNRDFIGKGIEPSPLLVSYH